MFRKFLLLAFLLIFFPIFAIYAQEEASSEDITGTEEEAAPMPLSDRPDFWLGVGGETAFYSARGLSYAYSFALGYGSGSSIGLKGSFFSNGQGLKVFEVDLLLRFYTFGKNTYYGPFIQILGGASMINYDNPLKIPSGTGVLNIGLGIGWRYLFANRFFLEPAFRFGYPYFMGLGISAGIRF